MMTPQTTDHHWYRPQFEAFERTLNGDAGGELHGLRRRAFARFLELGFPGSRHEDWRFTNVTPIARGRFVQPAPVTGISPERIARHTFGGLRCHRLVFLNGRYVPGLSHIGDLPRGMRVAGLADALRNDPATVAAHMARLADADENPFTALNTAFLRDGAFLHVPDGVDAGDPVHLLFLTEGTGGAWLIQPRNLIIAGAGARVSLVETYAHLDGGGYFTNAVSEIVLGPDAEMEHDRLQQEAEDAFHVGTVHVRQHARSRYTANGISLGGAIVRNTVTSVLAESGADCTLNGLSLGTGDQLVDNHTTIDHAAPACASHEVYKAILDGRARGVFNGKIFVRKDAQKTDAKQTNRTLLLSDDARIDTKPQLEIFADDVKCTHGATVGQLDEEQVFYLRSRGIGDTAARDILTFAFAADVVGRIHVDPLRDQLDRFLHERLHEGRVHRESDEA
jgi:Fe-S cluster assembly protein SufD